MSLSFFFNNILIIRKKLTFNVSGTAISQAWKFPGQRWINMSAVHIVQWRHFWWIRLWPKVKLSAVPYSDESSWVLSRTVPSQADCCPVQCWVNKNLLTGLENRLVTWQTRPHGIEYSKHRWDFYPHSPVFILKFLKMCSILFLHNHEPLHNKNLAHESWNRWAQANISAKSNHVRNFSH